MPCRLHCGVHTHGSGEVPLFPWAQAKPDEDRRRWASHASVPIRDDFACSPSVLSVRSTSLPAPMAKLLPMLPYPGGRGQIVATQVAATYGAHDGGCNANDAVSSLPRARRGEHACSPQLRSSPLSAVSSCSIKMCCCGPSSSSRKAPCGSSARDRDQTIPLALLEAGEFFGEMSYVDGAPTSAMVIADVPTRLRVIDEATVNNLTKKDPAFCGPALSLDCCDPCGAAPAYLDAPRLPDRRHRLLQPDPRRDRGRRCQAARAGLETGPGGGCGRPRAQGRKPAAAPRRPAKAAANRAGWPASFRERAKRFRERPLDRQ